MGYPLIFDLPLPPSKNVRPSSRAAWSFDARHKRRAWYRACEQHAPSLDPPEVVEVEAHFRTGAEWDEGNMVGALYAYTLDAISLPAGKAPGWRRGVHGSKGHIYDDSPRHCRLGAVTQRVVRDKSRRGVTLTVRAV